MKDRLKQLGLRLSGDQQQRLCIAHTLAVEPDAILMDGLYSALDPIATARIEDLLLEIQKKYTIVTVTHNMQQATRISNETAFFLNGELLEFLATGKLFIVLKDKRTEEYITGKFS